MDMVFQLLFQGIGIGSVYALVALGFVLIFRATNVVNFAQGEFSMVAAFLMVIFSVDLEWPYWISFLLSLGGMAAFFAGVVRAPLTGMILVTEMTLNVTLLLPMLAACGTAILVAMLLRDAPIYEALAERAGRRPGP